MMETRITHTCKVRSNRILQDDEVIFEGNPEAGFPEFIRAAYKALGGNYRKFYKMDDLCKLGFLAAEVLVQAAGLTSNYQGDEIGVVLSNAASSLDTDREHQRSVDDPAAVPPSPAVFVYTLPNIVIGEICIRHGITGENAFFIFDEAKPDFITGYIEDLLTQGKAEACIGGWVELDGQEYEAIMYTVEKGISDKRS